MNARIAPEVSDFGAYEPPRILSFPVRVTFLLLILAAELAYIVPGVLP